MQRSNSLSRRLRILHVEDSEVDAFLFSDAVEELTQDTITLATTGQEALDVLRTCTFDLVVLDLKLPLVHGFDVLQRLRETNKHTPVVVYTSSSSCVDYDIATSLGANAYVQKPVRMEDLHEFVEALHKFWAHHGRNRH